MTHQLIIEGWRFVPHSFAIVNQFQCLEFLKRKEIELFHRDVPYCNPNWNSYDNLFNQIDEIALENIKSPTENQFADVTLRIEYPYRFDLTNSQRTYVFMTVEGNYVASESLWIKCSLQEAHQNFDVVLMTPSNWSKNGLIRCGADPARIVVVPHGIDPAIYSPLSEIERKLLRTQFGVDSDFIFLSIGAMTPNKRMDLVLKAFVRILDKHPEARLVLKGLDNMYSSRDGLSIMLKESLTEAEINRVLNRLTYIGLPLPFSEIAKLYQMADVYFTPYGAEGFNLPVLEAAACGLPVICTRGGPTDDFTNSDFALYIDSEPVIPDCEPSSIWLNPNLEHLVELMNLTIESDHFRKSAKIKGYNFVHQNFTWKTVVDRLLCVFGFQ